MHLLFRMLKITALGMMRYKDIATTGILVLGRKSSSLRSPWAVEAVVVQLWAYMQSEGIEGIEIDSCVRVLGVLGVIMFFRKVRLRQKEGVTRI